MAMQTLIDIIKLFGIGMFFFAIYSMFQAIKKWAVKKGWIDGT